MKTADDLKLQKALGAHLRKLRRERGLSIRDVESRSELERGRISEIENGKRDPSATTLVKLAAGIGVHPNEIFRFDYPFFEE